VAEAHRPVLAAEVVGALEPHHGGLYVDGTVGAGGHAAAVLEAGGEHARLLGLDRDPQALELAGRRLQGFGRRARLHLGTFDRTGEALAAAGEGRADGILLDLGVSSMQLDNPRRGFSFRAQAPLDMRMGAGGPDAGELLAGLEEAELARLFRELGEEPFARRIAKALVRARAAEPVADTARLAELVAAALPAAERRKRKLHPATGVFMALRLAVNDELGMLERFLAGAPGWLAPGGRLAVISYHSLEDRRVKRALAAGADPCTCPPEIGACVCGRRPVYTLPTKKPVKPSAAETAANPRARSARLRVAVRTEAAA
jgi:16S rRNA (cytosine1402-N4)-methyltransferase